MYIFCPNYEGIKFSQPLCYSEYEKEFVNGQKMSNNENSNSSMAKEEGWGFRELSFTCLRPLFLDHEGFSISEVNPVKLWLYYI